MFSYIHSATSQLLALTPPSPSSCGESMPCSNTSRRWQHSASAAYPQHCRADRLLPLLVSMVSVCSMRRACETSESVILTGTTSSPFSLSRISLRCSSSSVATPFRSPLATSTWDQVRAVAIRLTLRYSTVIDLRRGMQLSGTFMPITEPLAVSARSAMPHACTPLAPMRQPR